jgi:phosphocarrier protein
MAQRRAVVGSSVGLHARPAALFVQAAKASDVPVRIGRTDAETVDARSILAVLTLDVHGGEEVVLTADGEGADKTLDLLADMIASDLETVHG